MHHIARSNRSSLQSSIPPPSVPTFLQHHQQQQQQQFVYSPVTTVQPCTAGLHPSCVYQNGHHNVSPPSPVPLQLQGKSNRWQTKNKVSRCQQQQQQQQQVSYPKPMVFYDQTPSNVPLPPSTTSFLVASSTFSHGPFPEHYSSSLPLIHQPYFKPPEVQAFCLLQDRQSNQQHGYYNISTTNCSLQTVNNSAFQVQNLPYTALTTFNQVAGPIQGVQSQIFPNSYNMVFTAPRENPFEVSFKSKDKSTGSHVLSALEKSPENEWSRTDDQFDVKSSINSDRTKTDPEGKEQEERYSDGSSASFDFTIEAEKMVSALCNTTSTNDLAKEDKKESIDLYNGAGDNPSNKWFDFYDCTKSVAVQTESCIDRSQYPELIRKTAYWSCTEAEMILNSKADLRSNWLMNLSSATRTAITKSSTCFPIFSGDRIFAEDLINSMLRVSNGWLVLDHYLNKQHYPSLSEKFDEELTKCFQAWEENTCELLKQITRTFMKLGENDTSDAERIEFSSFPGDVSLYTSSDLFQAYQNLKNPSGPRKSQSNKRETSQENKVRSKWTITENLKSASTKSVPTVMPDNTDKFRNKFRVRSTSKLDLTGSLNAEFCRLRNKVMESNQDAKRWQNEIHDTSKKSLSTSDATFGNILSQTQPMYFSNVTNVESNYNPANSYDFSKELKTPIQEAKNDSVYIGKSSTDQTGLSAVPRDKITLLSQIEPNVSEKRSEEMTANLSAWFASMRNQNTFHQDTRNAMDLRRLSFDANYQLQTIQNMQSIQTAPWNASNIINNRVQMHEEYDSSEDVRVYMKPGSYNVPKKRHQRKPNRRQENRQATGNRVNLYSAKEKSSATFSRGTVTTSTSSGSNNIASTIKVPFPATPIVPPPVFTLENSPRILKRDPTAKCSSSDLQRDVTWKAACASAEILLEALNIKESASNDNEENAEKNDVTEVQENLQQDTKLLKKDDAGNGTSSYEASGDDSDSTCKLSVKCSLGISQTREAKHTAKTNVKTDSWLIRTLSNASKKQKMQEGNVSTESSESSNSSIIDHQEFVKLPLATSATAVTEKFKESSLEQKDSKNESQFKDSDGFPGKATYSETVRRCVVSSLGKREASRKGKSISTCGTILPLPGRRCQRKDSERTFHLLHKSRKSTGKKKNLENEAEESSCSKSRSRSSISCNKSPSRYHEDRKKECYLSEGKSGKSGDRGWSVWYSSKRKQGLSPLALSKLEQIHQDLWRMDETQVLKCPASDDGQSSAETVESYCKIIKNPMFLETIGCKLKNRVYHRVEHVLRDFHRMVHNAKLYHKNDSDIKRIEVLSKKLDEMFEEHFSGWDFSNVSPREDSPVQLKHTGQKPGPKRKSPTTTENAFR